MTTGGIVEAVKQWIWREVKVLGLYSLWRSLGGTIWLVVFGLLMLGTVKYLSATPPDSFFIPVVPPPQTMILPPIIYLSSNAAPTHSSGDFRMSGLSGSTSPSSIAVSR